MLDHAAPDAGHVTPEQALRHRMRHSAAHVMAEAVLQLFPEAKFAIGPPLMTASTTTSTCLGPSRPKTWNRSRKQWFRP